MIAFTRAIPSMLLSFSVVVLIMPLGGWLRLLFFIRIKGQDKLPMVLEVPKYVHFLLSCLPCNDIGFGKIIALVQQGLVKRFC
jgi:hypothetical protein